MKYILTSSPAYDEKDELMVENGLVKLLHKLFPRKLSILYVASEPDCHEITVEYGSRLRKSFEASGFGIADWQILDRITDKNAVEMIAAADLLILAGGHVPTQNKYFREIKLRQLLKNYDGVIMGISAGSMNAADRVYAQPELDGEAVDPGFRRFLNGLGLTDINIIPHYQEIYDMTVDGLHMFKDIAAADSHKTDIYVIPDGSYIYCEDARAEKKLEKLYGEAWLMRAGFMKQIASIGDVNELPVSGNDLDISRN